MEIETTSFSCHILREMDYRRRSTNNFVNLSSFFLVEATGDSEADYDPNIHNNMDLSANDEDDAESCSLDDDYSDHSSCVTDPIVGFRLQANQSWQRSNGYMEVEQDYDEEEEEEEEEEGEEVVCGYNNKRWNPKSHVSADATNKSMNEAEKSKLFWETCLAS